jgi:N-acetylglucosamine kinase-like BadF-type ATPase
MVGEPGERDFVLAVDGGNTKSIAVVADLDGRVLALARGGCTDIYGAASLGAAHDELATIVTAAVATARVCVDDIATAVFSLAGADWPEDLAINADFVRQRFGVRDALIVNDAIGGLRSGTPDGVGVAVICGTFNAVGSRNRDGDVFHLGFWPDRTGAVDLSTEALRAVYRHGLRLGPSTALHDRVLALFGHTDANALLHAFTRRVDRLGRADLVRITPVLLDVAEHGDPVARSIVSTAGRALGGQARCAAERVGLPLDGVSVVVSGGVLQHPSTLIVDEIVACVPGAVAIRPSVPPIVGALMLARDRLGLVGDPSALGSALAEAPVSSGGGRVVDPAC